MSKFNLIAACVLSLASNFAMAQAILPASQPVAVPNIKNFEQIARDLKVTDFKGKAFTKHVKVAILDDGFAGWQLAFGAPKDGESCSQWGTVKVCYHGGPASEADANTSYHGTLMAKVLTQAVANSGATFDYELHLYNANGLTKFSGAVDSVIADKMDIVAYSQVWEWGGFGDGKGFVNAVVDRAVAAGVTWINAAGNYGKLTKRAAVDGKMDGPNEFVNFKTSANKDVSAFRIFCKAPTGQKCEKAQIYLVWNSFNNDRMTGTDKDLDLFLYDAKQTLVSSSEKIQMLTPTITTDNSSLVPRELIEKDLDPGTYLVKVKISSKNFLATQDQLKISVGGMYMSVDNPSLGETLMPPADNPGVIVIGASDDPQTNVSKSLSKPDLNFKSLLELDNGLKISASSPAAAMAAGVAVLEIGTGVVNQRAPLIEAMKSLSKKIAAPAKVVAPVTGPAAAKDAPVKSTPAKTTPTKPPVENPKFVTAPPKAAVRAPAPAPRRTVSLRATGPRATAPRRQLPNDSLPEGCLVSADPRGLPGEVQAWVRDGRAALVLSRGIWVLGVTDMRSLIDLSNLEDDQDVFISARGIAFVSAGEAPPIQSVQVLPTLRPICR